MKEYMNSDPVFSEKIKITETTDPAHADIINEAPIQVFQNTLCNRKAIEAVEKRAGNTPEYNEEEIYAPGVYRLHNGVLYKSIKDTSGEWDPECWEQTDALGEIGTVKEELSAVKTPEFDDSGVVDTIKSFPDFLETFVSKINIFQFLRNLKAGLQFVLHAGQIVNNCTSEAEDLLLSAKQGKVLMDLYTQLYSDYSHKEVIVSNQSVDSIYNGRFYCCNATLKAGKLYLVIAHALVDADLNNTMSLSIVKRSGKCTMFGTYEGTRTSSTAGGGLCNVRLVHCETDCEIALEGYGYISTPHKYNGSITAVAI